MTTFAVLLLCGILVSSSVGQIRFPTDESGGNEQSGLPQSSSPNLSSAPGEGNQTPSNDPQSRFFGLFGGPGLGSFACHSCSPSDPVKADRCCRRGERQCCGFSNFFGGSPIPPVPISGHSGGFQPVGPPGFFPGGGSGGFGSNGFGGNGFGGNGFGSNGFGGGSQKFGFCPRPSIFSGIGNFLGLRDGLGDDKKSGLFADESKVKPHHRPARQVTFEDTQNKAASADPSNPASSDQPNARFLPIFSGLPNPFCRDQCFTDLDCPGSLKCCIDLTNCRQCTFPKQSFF